MIEVIGSHEKERLAAKLERVRQRNVVLDADLMKQVGSIIDDVRVRGDAAIINYAEQFDGCTMQRSELRIGPEELRRIAANVDANVLEALREAISNVRRFHEHERQESWEIETEYGVRLGQPGVVGHLVQRRQAGGALADLQPLRRRRGGGGQ